MGWMPGLVQRPGANAGNFGNAKQNCRLHFTVGTDSSGIGDQGYFHFLVPKQGTPMQFAPTEAVCWDACEWNPTGFGIEFERMSGEEPLTSDQVSWGGKIIAWAHASEGIPLVFRDTPDDRMPVGTEFHGFTTHRSLHENQCPEHYDFITQDEWNAMSSGPSPTPASSLPEGDDMIAQWNADGVESVASVSKDGTLFLDGYVPGLGRWVLGYLTGPGYCNPAAGCIYRFSAGYHRVYAQYVDGKHHVHSYWDGKEWRTQLLPGMP